MIWNKYAALPDTKVIGLLAITSSYQPFFTIPYAYCHLYACFHPFHPSCPTHLTRPSSALAWQVSLPPVSLPCKAKLSSSSKPVTESAAERTHRQRWGASCSWSWAAAT